MAKYKPKLKWGIYYPNDLYFSEAYQVLTKSARNLLHCLMSEVKLKRASNRKRTKSYFYPNNGDISFTQAQFTSYFGCVKDTYSKSKNQLIETGCIKMTYQGGMGAGDMTKYKILTLQHIPIEHQRWREYPKKNWGHEIPKPKKQLVGVKTQWKKGQSGRKKPKATLLK